MPLLLELPLQFLDLLFLFRQRAPEALLFVLSVGPLSLRLNQPLLHRYQLFFLVRFRALLCDQLFSQVLKDGFLLAEPLLDFFFLVLLFFKRLLCLFQGWTYRFAGFCYFFVLFFQFSNLFKELLLHLVYRCWQRCSQVLVFGFSFGKSLLQIWSFKFFLIEFIRNEIDFQLQLFLLLSCFRDFFLQIRLNSFGTVLEFLDISLLPLVFLIFFFQFLLSFLKL